MPSVVLYGLLAVSVGLIVLTKLSGGSFPWGHLLIAVGRDGRPMRPRVKWHIWSISRGERPWLAAAAGLVSTSLGVVSLVFVLPHLYETTVVHPMNATWTFLVVVITAAGLMLTPIGLSVMVQAGLDLTARRSSMVGTVVGMRKDRGLFGATYRIAVQAGDREMTRRLFWADAFRVDHATFKRLTPGDRISIEYSPHLRFVYKTSEALDRDSSSGARGRVSTEPAA